MKLFISMLFMWIPFGVLAQGAQQLLTFEDSADLFFSKYVVNGYVDYGHVYENQVELNGLVTQIEKMDVAAFNDLEKQAFYINTYNLLVIDQVIKNYPTSSVKDISGFFDRTKYNVGNTSMTLNRIEKDLLLKVYKDSRFHLVLVCGAKDCPKLWNQAYRSIRLEQQLKSRSNEVLSDTNFIKIAVEGYEFSEIFKWNRFEFDGKEGMIDFINSFRIEPIKVGSKIAFYDYNWTLNDVRFVSANEGKEGNNSFRYVTSAAIPKGGVEVKLFNNLYSQIEGSGEDLDRRSTYFTSSLNFLYGTSNRLNIGFTTRYRRVLNNQLPSSPLDVFSDVEGGNGRQRITAFGPMIRWAPFKNLSNFSIQSSLSLPIGKNLSGGQLRPFLDWAGPVFTTQFFNDKTIGDKFSLFTEVDIVIEEIGGGKANRVSTPITVILSWFPIKNFTVYGLVGYSPYFVNPYDYFTQVGMGVKYQLSPHFEIELLATDFSNKYLNTIGGGATTYNIGFRYSR